MKGFQPPSIGPASQEALRIIHFHPPHFDWTCLPGSPADHSFENLASQGVPAGRAPNNGKCKESIHLEGIQGFRKDSATLGCKECKDAGICKYSGRNPPGFLQVLD